MKVSNARVGTSGDAGGEVGVGGSVGVGVGVGASPQPDRFRAVMAIAAAKKCPLMFYKNGKQNARTKS